MGAIIRDKFAGVWKFFDWRVITAASSYRC